MLLISKEDFLGVTLPGRALRSNLFARSSQKVFPLQSLTQKERSQMKLDLDLKKKWKEIKQLKNTENWAYRPLVSNCI